MNPQPKGFVHRRSAVFMLLLFSLSADASVAGNRSTYPIPEDRGTAGISAALERLPVYARVLETTAHPDDENAPTLTWLGRRARVRTALFVMTRGEGGQNVLGSETYDALGIVRTGEFLEACRSYGSELYFSTAYDFGFSKNAEETFAKWGHDESLAEMVRLIRRWRPNIILSEFQGTPRDGHGHHQATGLLTREAFRAAGDAKRFPEQLEQGLRPWQATKLYVDNTRAVNDPPAPGTPADTGVAPDDWTVAVPVGDYDPVLGRSYREIAVEGYSKHRSQGSGAGAAQPAGARDYYKLVDSTVGIQARESSFFDSIDTTLPAILESAGRVEDSLSFLKDDLKVAQAAAEEAIRVFQPNHPEVSAAAVARGAAALTRALDRMERSRISTSVKAILEDALEQKIREFDSAENAVLGTYLLARAEDAVGVPGETVSVTVSFYNRGSETVELTDLVLRTPPGWSSSRQAGVPLGTLSPGSNATVKFTVALPAEAKITQPYFHRPTLRDARYQLRPTDDLFAPFGRPELSAEATYRYCGRTVHMEEAVSAQAGDPIRGSDYVDFQVVPALSVSLKPNVGIVPAGSGEAAREFQVSVLCNEKHPIRGSLNIDPPAGWHVDPPTVPFDLGQRGETFNARFTVLVPPRTPVGSYPLGAVAVIDGKEFRDGYRVVSYPEIWTRNVYSPAESDLRVCDVATAPNLTVGYVMGAGDDVPASLEQLGLKVRILSGSDLAFGDLGRFSVIVTGIRAYNVNSDLRADNQRLLRYVEDGGTLIVQYNRLLSTPKQSGLGAPFPYGPYEMANSDLDRITVEDSPITILFPENPVFNQPNKIVDSDFQGWVQERGLYFMKSWDPRYTPLLSGHDPGEEPKNGGMLVARVGKGYYVYTSYAWFRQLPAGVPGAYRLFANLLSLGK